jgi:hypothetical protein
MSFYFSPTNKNRLKQIRKSFSENISSKSSSSKAVGVVIQDQETSGKQIKTSNETTELTSSQQHHHHHHQPPETSSSRNSFSSSSSSNLERKPSNSAAAQFVMMPSVKSRLIKNISRTKEKILQGIGKTDKTNDENFDLYVENFERQYAQAHKLNKELNKYLSSLKETHKSSRAFYETLKETYEQQWPNAAQFGEQVDQSEMKWSEYVGRLHRDVQLPLASYLNEFPELKKKIEKRCNRLLDYDNARHSLENAQNKSLKKNLHQLNTISSSSQQQHHNNSHASNNNSSSSSSSSSNSAHQHNNSTIIGGGSNNSSNVAAAATDQLTKLTKLKIDLEDKQHVYEELNQTLCMALPVLFENRVKFYASLFQTLFHTETLFHSEALESKSKLDEICESLSLKISAEPSVTTTAHFKMISKKLNSLNGTHGGGHSNGCGGGNTSGGSSHGSAENVRNGAQLDDDTELDNEKLNLSSNESSSNAPPPPPSSVTNSNHIVTEFVPKANLLNETSCYSSSEDIQQQTTTTTSYIQTEITNLAIVDRKRSLGGEVPKSTPPLSSSSSSPPKTRPSRDRIAFKVKATYPYEAKELDELTFVKEDVIAVVDGTESEKEDLDDGWLIGIHETTSRRGLFPENFTKRIS